MKDEAVSISSFIRRRELFGWCRMQWGGRVASLSRLELDNLIWTLGWASLEACERFARRTQSRLSQFIFFLSPRFLPFTLI